LTVNGEIINPNGSWLVPPETGSQDSRETASQVSELSLVAMKYVAMSALVAAGIAAMTSIRVLMHYTRAASS
jgi:hypothetical protein